MPEEEKDGGEWPAKLGPHPKLIQIYTHPKPIQIVHAPETIPNFAIKGGPEARVFHFLPQKHSTHARGDIIQKTTIVTSCLLR